MRFYVLLKNSRWPPKITEKTSFENHREFTEIQDGRQQWQENTFLRKSC